ncbi:MAG: lysine 2,3-aminomutase, partial [Thermodesulfobacteriota bacterium]
SRPVREIRPDHRAFKDLKASLSGNHNPGYTMVPTGSPSLLRPHETRVELNVSAATSDLDYIRNDDRITDVVIFSENDCLEKLHEAALLVKRIGDIPQVNAIRLRSPWFNFKPEKYTAAVVHRLTELNRLSIATPKRLEIETWFFHSRELRREHETLAARLRNKGITVYVNTPLLSGLNDSSQEIHELAYAVRSFGLEFHHLYLAGLPVQKQWNVSSPVDIDDILDIAARVRREGSGREIPRYIILTELGEVDFGLTSRLIKQNGQVAVKLLPYDLTYFQNLQPDFVWPKHVETDDLGKPVVPVPGLTSTTGFLFG